MQVRLAFLCLCLSPLGLEQWELGVALVDDSHSRADGGNRVSHPCVSVLHASLRWGPPALLSQPSHYTL